MGEAAIRHRGEQGGVKSLDDLDEAIKVIGLYDIKLERIKHDMETQITAIKTAAKAEAAIVKADRSELLAIAETYVHAAKDQVLNGKKTATLNFGKVGFRKKPDKIALPKKNSKKMEELAALIESLKAKEDAFAEVSVRTQKYVLQADVASLSDESLGIIDLTRKQGRDEFFVEPKREKLEMEAVSNG